MSLTLEPTSDAATTEAIRASVAAACISLRPDARAASAWWQAGIVEAFDRAVPRTAPASRYDAALPPRSTRGATRA